jgi:predicted transcriptional regulator
MKSQNTVVLTTETLHRVDRLAASLERSRSWSVERANKKMLAKITAEHGATAEGAPQR